MGCSTDLLNHLLGEQAHVSLRLRILFGVATALLVVAIVAVPRSLRMPASVIEASLLKMAPLGSTSDEVQRRLATKGFHPTLTPTGFYKQKNPAKPEVVGASSIRIELGEYRTPFVTSVSAFWGFDKEGKLIDVWVWKTIDAL
jgi:hypothetical protein